MASQYSELRYSIRRDKRVLALEQSIRSLAQFSQEQLSESRYAISIYEKAGELTLSQMKTRIKSRILTGLRSHPQLVTLSNLHEHLVHHALSLVEAMDKKYKGFVIFMQFDAFELDRAQLNGKKFPENILFSQLFSLYSEPDTHIYIGKIFDFSPLFRLIRRSPTAIAAQIENQEARIFLIKGRSIEEVDQLENKYNEPTDKEYVELHRPGGNGKIVHGTGAENIARRQLSANKAFLDDIAESIEKLNSGKLNSGKKWQQLVVYASKNFQPYLNEWAEEAFHGKFVSPPLISFNIFNKPNDLLEDARDKIRRADQERIKNLFQTDRENPSLFSTDWKVIADAVREHRVERLFIPLERMDEWRAGFIVNKSMPYSYPVSGARKVRNLLPWLAHGVIASGGQVIAAKILGNVSKKPVAAKLRYAAN